MAADDPTGLAGGAIELAGDAAILAAILASQRRAVEAVERELPALAAAAHALAERLRGAGRLIYAGAGSSGLIAIQDGAELPGTFGLAREQVVFLMAGGIESIYDLVGGAEDDVHAALSDIGALGDLSKDVMIAVSASGATRYTVAAARAMHEAGGCVIAIAGRRPSPLLDSADHPILLDSGEEVVAGSTRLAAGTAQKCALGLLSTLANIRLGHVYDGLMVGLRPDNAKLAQRAVDIVAQVTGMDRENASAELRAAGGSVKAAILIGLGVDREFAEELLAECGGDLRAAVDRLRAKLGDPSRSGSHP